MIKLATNSRLTRWFVWCCDNLPATGTRDYAGNNDHEGVRRTGAYYLEHGTTLCHVFWAMLWVPLVASGVAAFFVFMIGMMHVEAYHQFSDKIGPVAVLMPEVFGLGMAALLGLILLVIIGGDKSGFFRLLWQYLSGVKSRICPLVKFAASTAPTLAEGPGGK